MDASGNSTHPMTPTLHRSWLSGPYSGPLYRPVSMYSPCLPRNIYPRRKAPYVEIRLRGTPAENTAALAALGQVLHFATISRPYPDRAPSTAERIYVTATQKETK